MGSVAVMDELANAAAELEAATRTFTDLSRRRDEVQKQVDELRKQERRTQVQLAQGEERAGQQLTRIQQALALADGKLSGLLQLLADEEPRLASLRQRWSGLKRKEAEQQRADEVTRLTAELAATDGVIEQAEAAVYALKEKRNQIFEQRLALQHQN